MPLPAGSRLGPYEVRSLIGAGGMGQVYLARDARLDRLVAIKVLKPEFAADPLFRARFDREARTSSRLDHPGICAIYDVGDADSACFLVMQYLDGVPLSERIAQGAMPIGDVARIGVALSSALTYAHGHGIVHRDIKPHNIILLKDGRPALLDFGIARPAPEGEQTAVATQAALTESGELLGTPEYMAPEQLRGSVANGQSDIFSLGLVLHELASGTHPFRGSTRVVTVSAILQGQYRALSARTPLEKHLRAIVERMLAPQTADRYTTMAECLADLRELERKAGGDETAPSIANPPRAMLAYVGGAFRRPAVAAAAAIALLLYVGARFVDQNTVDSDRPAPATTPAPATVATDRATFWLDMEISPRGSRFRVNLDAAAGFFYLMGEEPPSAANPSGLTLLHEGATMQSEWYVFTGGPARELLWVIWSSTPIEDLASLRPSINERDRGVLRDPVVADRVRALLARGAGRTRILTGNAGASRTTLEGTGGLLVHRLELQHG